MKVYIAGPMTGLPEFNYPAFNAAADALLGAGHEPVNPTDNADGPAHPWEWCMRQSLSQVLNAEGIALLAGWSESRGAKLERLVGRSIGIPVEPIVWWTGWTL